MSSSSSISVSDEFTGFSSASNGSTGRVIETNKDIDLVVSSATISCMKDLSEEAIDVEAKERAERVEEKLSLRLGYDWVTPKVWEYISQYRYSSIIRCFLSNISIYCPDATDEVISFRHARAICNVCYGHDG